MAPAAQTPITTAGVPIAHAVCFSPVQARQHVCGAHWVSTTGARPSPRQHLRGSWQQRRRRTQCSSRRGRRARSDTPGRRSQRQRRCRSRHAHMHPRKAATPVPVGRRVAAVTGTAHTAETDNMPPHAPQGSQNACAALPASTTPQPFLRAPRVPRVRPGSCQALARPRAASRRRQRHRRRRRRRHRLHRPRPPRHRRLL